MCDFPGWLGRVGRCGSGCASTAELVLRASATPEVHWFQVHVSAGVVAEVILASRTGHWYGAHQRL